jgi:hypothetical protein
VRRKALLANVINRLVLDGLRWKLVEAFGLWCASSCGPRRVMLSLFLCVQTKFSVALFVL